MPMSQSLREFLDKVWAKRADPHLDIYQLYSGRAHGMPAEGPTELAGYGADLGKLAVLLPSPVVQPGTAELATLMGMDWDGATPDDVAMLSFWLTQAETMPAVLGSLLVSFLHFTKEERDASAWRVYLNIFPAHTVAVTRFVVNDVLNSIPAVGNAKVLGPLGVGRDRVVIYAADKASAEQAVERLKRFQQGCPSMFRGDSVAMTKQVARGISIGEEPPAARLQEATGTWTSRGSSFGAFREDLIGMALRRQRPGATKEQFLLSVEKLFRCFGIDPMKPHKQADRSFAERLAALDLGRLAKASALQQGPRPKWWEDVDAGPARAPTGRSRSPSL